MDKDYENAKHYYAMFLQNYFATFATYATSTAVLLAAASIGDSIFECSPLATIGFAALGIFLCLQWHIATSFMRDQYRYFAKRVRSIEKRMRSNSRIVTDWNEIANRELGRNISDPDELNYLKHSSRKYMQLWGLGGASLPVIYSSIFIFVFLKTISFSPFEDLWSLPLSVAWFLYWNYFVYLEQDKKEHSWEVRGSYLIKRRKK